MDEGMLQKIFGEVPEKLLRFGLRLLVAILVLIIVWKLIGWLVKLVRRAMSKAGVDQGVIQFTCAFLNVLCKMLLIFVIAMGFGVDTAGAIALLGGAGVTIGLAVQGSLSNLAGGIMILVVKPFRVGDYIREDTQGHEGTVQEISLFTTRLTTYDNKLVVLPNGSLANTSVTNFTGMTKRMLEIKIGVAYDTDIALAKETLLAVAKEHPAVFQDEEILVFLDAFADSAMVMGLRCFVPVTDFKKRLWDMNEKIKTAFDEKGIVIPFPQHDVHLIQAQS